MFDEKNIQIFSSRDNIRKYMIDAAKEYLEVDNLDFDQASYMSYLIDIISVLTSNLIFYNTSVWREFFLTTALQEDSVLELGTMLGYKPRNATPATCIVLVGMDLSQFPTDGEVDIVLPALELETTESIDDNYNTITTTLANNLIEENDYNIFKFYAGNDTQFMLKNRVEISLSEELGGSRSVSIREIIINSQGSVSTSNKTYRDLVYWIDEDINKLYFAVQAYQSEIELFDFSIDTLKPYELYYKNIKFNNAENYLSSINLISTTTSGSPSTGYQNPYIWKEYDSLYLIPSGKRGFVYTQTSEGIRVFFGNNVLGKQPESNSRFLAYLELTKGAGGNVIGGSITKADTIYASITRTGQDPYTKPVDATIINTANASGGKDKPSIDEMRSEAITRFSTGKRLVTSYDYENIESISDDLPIHNAIPILKRSDLKRNEICVFTDLAYDDDPNIGTYVVPTRNTSISFNTSNSTYKMYKGDEITIDDELFYLMFDLSINTTTKDCTYIYYVTDVTSSLTLTASYGDSTTKALPLISIFDVFYDSTDSNYVLNVQLKYDKFTTDDLSGMGCELITKEGKTYTLSHDYSNQKFYTSLDSTTSDPIPISDISDGEQKFTFKMYDVSSTNLLNESYVEITVYKELDDYMYSQVRGDTTSAVFTVYDVPVIKKSYYDSVDKSIFDLNIYQKISSFDVTKLKMLTDFVNLKFANTTGYITNMSYNDVDRDPVIDILKTPPTSPSNGDRYAVIDPDNTFPKADDGYIYTWTITGGGRWIEEKINVNDYFYVTNRSKYVIYNGKSLVEPNPPIPLELYIVVFIDSKYGSMQSTIVNEIKNSLIDKMYSKFGYEKNIYISEITKIVKSIKGVKNCNVLKPEHDIFFNYTLDDFTESELLAYTPELVYFDTKNITIEIR